MMGLRKSKKSSKVSTTFYAGEVEIHLRGVLSFIILLSYLLGPKFF